MQNALTKDQLIAQKYMMQAFEADKRIEQKIKLLQRVREQANSIHSPNIETTRVQSSKIADSVCDSVTNVIELEEQISTSINALVKMKENVMQTIDEVVDCDEQQFLYHRFLAYAECRLKTIEAIAADMYISQRTVYRLQRKALNTVYTILQSRATGIQ